MAQEPFVPKSAKGVEYELFQGKYYFRERSAGPEKEYMRCVHCKKGTAIKTNGIMAAGHVAHLEDCDANHNRIQFVERELRNEAKARFSQRSAIRAGQAHQAARDSMAARYGADILEGVHLPVNSISSSMYKARAERIPPVPHTFDEIPEVDEFPEQYMHTLDDVDEQFLYVNAHFGPNGEQRILAFTTQWDLQQLARAEKVYIDGTFKVTPRPFTQLVTLNTMIGPNEERSLLVPRIYFLLPNKTEAVYAELLDLVLTCVEELFVQYNVGDGNVRWRCFSCDFESGLLAALTSDAFDPDHMLRIEGCHFHYCAAVYRRIVQHGPNSMHADYHDLNDDSFRVFVKKLFALPFLPPDRVIAGFEDLLQTDAPPHLVNTARFGAFIAYYANQWVYNDVYRVLVNCYGRAGHRRTNNNLEGWHNKIKALLQVHPNLWVFIENLQALQQSSREEEVSAIQDPLRTIRLRAGRQRDKEEALWNLSQMYQPGGGQFANDLYYVRLVAERMNVF